jgi:DNA-nicking Smr family endonuclease
VLIFLAFAGTVGSVTGTPPKSRIAIKTGLKALGVLRGKIAAAPSAPNPAAKPKKARPSRLTEAEQDIWDHVADSVAPVRVKARVPLNASPEAEADEQTPKRLLPKAARVPQPAPETKAAPVTAARVTPPSLGDFDAKKAKRLGRGQIDIDARLDLHGDRLGEAHERLRAFLFSCHSNGKRTVLVITGKGRETDAANDTDDIGYERRERGVLRRNVPRWLAEPELRSIVVSYTEAHIRHGGEGAVYIHLRRKR